MYIFVKKKYEGNHLYVYESGNCKSLYHPVSLLLFHVMKDFVNYFALLAVQSSWYVLKLPVLLHWGDISQTKAKASYALLRSFT